MKLNLKIMLFWGVVILSAGCMEDKTTKDCQEFNKGFLETCNRDCPRRCTEVVRESKTLKQIATEEIEKVCTDSCAKHCSKTLDKIKPTQCQGKV